jgi:hypothetical protein
MSILSQAVESHHCIVFGITGLCLITQLVWWDQREVLGSKKGGSTCTGYGIIGVDEFPLISA